MIVIVDYGMGNVGSIVNMFRKVGAQVEISSNPARIEQATKLVLPGVGAFDHGMKNIAERGLRPALDQKVLREGTPILGVCLGMQLFTRRSDEGTLPGLGWIEADTVRFDRSVAPGSLKIPHMGWNSVTMHGEHPLFNDMPDAPRFYFVHSFHLRCDDPSIALTSTRHGYDFVSGVAHGNIVGVQFHPEKSHKYGMKLFANFSRWT